MMNYECSGWGPLTRHALAFAQKAHEGQVRKYTGVPYVLHPIAVAETLFQIGASDIVCAAAILHDVLEDTGTTIVDLLAEFGVEVANLVAELTDVYTPRPGVNRAERKRLECERLAQVSAEAQTIKVADLIDNTSNIVEHDPDFAPVYLAEKRELLKVLTKADARLLGRAWEGLQ